MYSGSYFQCKLNKEDAVQRHILLIEDDPWQADSIKENLRSRARSRPGLRLAFTWVSSEVEALRWIYDRTVQFDAYIVDAMIPWSQSDAGRLPLDPRVDIDGPTRAGLRIVEKILLIRLSNYVFSIVSGPPIDAPIIVYSVGVDPDSLTSFPDFSSVFFIAKSESDRTLADFIVDRLSDES